MDIESFRDYCLSLPEVEETLPFDDSTLVYKIGGRMFAMLALERPDHFAVKCNPDRALMLRERYFQVTAAWHLNKRHWNDVAFEGHMSDEQLRAELRHSYLTVIRQNVTPRARRDDLLALAAAAGVVDDAECEI
ncbi:MAG: MmcQ/YjbR family DNA-binding protein [Alistipes sp.]|nr:MmcQ/YjbR family DNA-binding protein [Alistipes sp.]